MKLETAQEAVLVEYLGAFDGLIGDQRTGVTFRETVKGIIGAGSLVCQRIAASSAVLSVAKESGQRVSRMVTGESTKRSQINAETLTAALCERGIAHLAGADSDELWVIADGSELRKPYAREMPVLMQVRDLDGNLVPGYRTMNVLGITPSRRGILYHRLFSRRGRLSERIVGSATRTANRESRPGSTQAAQSSYLDYGQRVRCGMCQA